MKITAAIIALLLSVITVSAAVPDFQERERHRKECMEHLRVIGEAIKAYRADHNDQMPDWLHYLYPKYLQDPQILICPADDAGGVPDLFVSHKGPRMSCSYVYAFNPLKPITAVGFAILGGDSRMQWANAAQPRALVRRDGQLFEFYSEGKLPLSMLPDIWRGL